MQLKDKSIESEPEELSTKAVLWVLVIMVVVVALMFASVYGKGYLAYGGVAFAVMTAIIVHLTVRFISDTSRTTNILIVHGIIWVTAISIAIFWRTKRENRELAEFGIAYNAPVIDLYTVKGTKRRRGTQFQARIRYEVRGKVYVKSIVNSRRILELSDTARIVYSSEDPVLFGVVAFIKRKMPNKPDTATFQGVGPDTASLTDSIATSGNRFPQFKGGSSAFYEYIRTHLVYPATGIVSRRVGVVYLSFMVNKDGSVKDVQVTQGINQLYDAAAVKVLKESPKWLPGTRDGEPIKVKYNVPIRFSL